MTQGSVEKQRTKGAVNGGTWITVNRVKPLCRPIKSFDRLMIFETYLQSYPEAWINLMTVFLKSENEVTH